MLSNRRRQVLNALIEEYISTAQPVSSKAIVGKRGLGVSSATVRNELYVLEEDGYVVSPHVSSGRIPTDIGYRTFVDELLENIPEDTEQERETDNSIAGDLRESASELDDLLRQTTRALNRFTDCLAVVMAPRVTRIALKKIALVQMDATHVIVVIAVKDGRVLNRVVELAGEHGPEEVHALERMLNERYDIPGGFDPLGKAAGPDAGAKPEGGEVKRAKAASAAAVAELERLETAIDDCLFEGERDRLHLNGIEDLFAQPEMQKMSLTMGFARLLDDDLMMFRLLGDFLAHKDGVAVRIGHENPDETFSDISVVASSYGADDREGIVAIVGPTRMNYQKVIDAVRRASGFLDETMKDKD